MLFAGLGSVRIVKDCDLGQHFQDLGHSFSLYGPPSLQITYIFTSEDTEFSHLVFHWFLYNKEIFWRWWILSKWSNIGHVLATQYFKIFPTRYTLIIEENSKTRVIVGKVVRDEVVLQWSEWYPSNYRVRKSKNSKSFLYILGICLNLTLFYISGWIGYNKFTRDVCK